MTRVAVVGTGLVGGSIGLALRAGAPDIEVRGFDRDIARATRARELGAIDEVVPSLAEAMTGVDVVVVAVPVAAVAAIVAEALDAGVPAVTDVASVKAPVVAELQRIRPEHAARFVGGHPMAGSEQDGLDGADAALFLGATWVLTPTEHTDDAAYAAVRGLVAEMGADVVSVTPDRHDDLVAVVSHVPQLAASTLMGVAAAGGEQHATLLRLAAGGFRDMTRIAAGHPGIWPDICVANRDAIVRALDEYAGALDDVRRLVATADREGLLEVLERARAARRNLPVGGPTDEPLVELRVPVPDRPGAAADVTTVAGELGVNLVDFEVAHSIEGGRGVMILLVPSTGAEKLESALAERGYHCSRTALP